MTSRKVSVVRTKQRAVRDEKKALAEVAKATTDSFQNFAANLGIGADNLLSGGSYGFNPITRIRTLLEWIHRGSWIGGVAVDVVADDMTRAGVEIKSTMAPDDKEALQNAFLHRGIWEAINDGVKWGRLYGGAVLVYMIEGQDPSTPLKLETVGKEQFKGLLVLDRWMVEPSLENLVTDFGPALGYPKFYRVTADAPALRSMTIHYSRVIRLEGVRLPYWQRIAENMWGLSVLERLYDRMIAFDSASTGAAQLVYKAHIRTYAIEDLREIIAAGGKGLQGLVSYVDMMRRFQGIEGMTLMDKKDEFQSHTPSAFSGLSDALVQFGQQLSGALQIPLVRLFGQSPSGLNSTGESDMRLYYDQIKQQQNRYLRAGLLNIFKLIAQSEGIDLEDNFNFEFRPLWQLTEEQKSSVASSSTETILKAEEAGVIDRATALREMRTMSAITGVFTNITDEMIEEAEQDAPMIEELQEQLAGAQAQSPLGPDGQPLDPGASTPAPGEAEAPPVTAVHGGELTVKPKVKPAKPGAPSKPGHKERNDELAEEQ